MPTQPGYAARHLRDRILADGPIRHTTEYELQDAIDRQLNSPPEWAFQASREHRLDEHNRIDFFVRSLVFGETKPFINVGIEVKIGSALAAVTRQLARYAEFDEIDELLLVTTKAVHHRIPAELNGKPVVLCSLVEAGL